MGRFLKLGGFTIGGHRRCLRATIVPATHFVAEGGNVAAVTVDSTLVDWKLSRVEDSRYVDFVFPPPEPHRIIIGLR